MTNWVSVAAELKRDEDNENTGPINTIFGEHMGLYDFLGDSAEARSRS